MSATVENNWNVRQSAIRQMEKWANDQTGNPTRSGDELHRLADTFSHQGFTAWVNPSVNTRTGRLPPRIRAGHADAFKAPDWPSLAPDVAMRMFMTLWSITPERGCGPLLSLEEAVTDMQIQFSVDGGEPTRCAAIRELIRRRFSSSLSQ
jgi:hypothetical protein